MGSILLGVFLLILVRQMSHLTLQRTGTLLSLPKIFAQELPDGENIAPTKEELFTNDTVMGGTIPFLSQTIIMHGPRTQKQVALTFDADMTPWMKQTIMNGSVANSFDRRIIDILQKSGTKATFFMTGLWIEMYRSEVEKLSRDPLFAFGNHSYSHPSFDGNCYGLRLIPDAEDITEVEKTQKLLQETTGTDPEIFRFPGGCYSTSDISIVTNFTHLQVVHWDVVGNDGFNNDVESIEQNVLSHVENGSIIVLHMNGAPNAPRTADALPVIIQTLHTRGYTFVTLPELLHLPAE